MNDKTFEMLGHFKNHFSLDFHDSFDNVKSHFLKKQFQSLKDESKVADPEIVGIWEYR